MDRIITASEANQRFSEMLRDVAGGESFVVTSRGRPVARVTPVEQAPNAEKVRQLIDRLAEEPIRYSGPWTRDDLYE